MTDLLLILTVNSVGQYVVDSLASRFGLPLLSDKGGLHAHGKVMIGDTLVELSLFKTSECPIG